MKIRSAALLLAALAALVGCGEAALPVGPLQLKLSPPAAQPDIRPQVLAELDRVPSSRFIEMPDWARIQNEPRLARQGFVVREEIIGDVATWQDANRTTLNFRQGVLISTRGFGGDLMSADVSQVLDGVHGQAQHGQRVHRVLGGEDQLVVTRFDCTYHRGAGVMTDPLVAGQKAMIVVERCAAPDGPSFENRYWIDSGGVIRQSTQWVSTDVGRLNSVLLKD